MFNVDAIQVLMHNRSDPAVCFIMWEITFALSVTKAIMESLTKHNYIVLHLPPHDT